MEHIHIHDDFDHSIPKCVCGAEKTHLFHSSCACIQCVCAHGLLHVVREKNSPQCAIYRPRVEHTDRECVDANIIHLGLYESHSILPLTFFQLDVKWTEHRSTTCKLMSGYTYIIIIIIIVARLRHNENKRNTFDTLYALSIWRHEENSCDSG